MKYRLYFGFTGGEGNLYNTMKFNAYRCDNYSTLNPDGCDHWTGVNGGWVKDFDGSTQAKSIVSPINIAPNNSNWWKIETWLDISAGNGLKNKTATFTLFGNGTQPTNPGWSE